MLDSSCRIAENLLTPEISLVIYLGVDNINLSTLMSFGMLKFTSLE